MFPRNFAVPMGKLPTWQQVVGEFGKRQVTTDTKDFSPRQPVTDLLRTCRLCCGFVTGKWPTCYGLTTGKLVYLMDCGLNRAGL